MRIPFKSLRYPGSGPQKWGLNVLRKVQRTGYVDTWTDVRRASSSFLGQAGAIDGIHDMKRGVVTELQPFVTTASNGTVGGFGPVRARRHRGQPGREPAVRLHEPLDRRHVNPDFSQVESDAGQVTVNERFALFYPEKRPFFLEGIELFSTPNQLVYTRQIAEPLAGGKLTGKLGRMTVAYLTAKDRSSAGGALFNVGRVRADFGQNSTIGVTFTDRSTADGFNRVAAVDSRIVFAKLYYVQGQFGRSWTGQSGGRQRCADLARRVRPDRARVGLQLQADRDRRELPGAGRLRAPQRHRRVPRVEPAVVVRRARRLRRAVHHVLRAVAHLALRGLRPCVANRGEPGRQPDVQPAGRVERARLARPRLRAVRRATTTRPTRC